MNTCENCRWRTRPERGAKLVGIKPICVVRNKIIEVLDDVCGHHEVFE